MCMSARFDLRGAVVCVASLLWLACWVNLVVQHPLARGARTHPCSLPAARFCGARMEVRFFGSSSARALSTSPSKPKRVSLAVDQSGRPLPARLTEGRAAATEASSTDDEGATEASPPSPRRAPSHRRDASAAAAAGRAPRRRIGRSPGEG